MDVQFFRMVEAHWLWCIVVLLGSSAFVSADAGKPAMRLRGLTVRCVLSAIGSIALACPFGSFSSGDKTCLAVAASQAFVRTRKFQGQLADGWPPSPVAEKVIGTLHGKTWRVPGCKTRHAAHDFVLPKEGGLWVAGLLNPTSGERGARAGICTHISCAREGDLLSRARMKVPPPLRSMTEPIIRTGGVSRCSGWNSGWKIWDGWRRFAGGRNGWGYRAQPSQIGAEGRT